MNKFLYLLCVLTLAAPVWLVADDKPVQVRPKHAPAQQASPAPEEIKSKPADETTPFAIKNKSSFNIDPAARSPFWPIGFKPTARVAAGGVDSDQGEVPPGAFLLSSITIDERGHFAIINGKTMREGQTFGLQIGTQIYQVSVKRIEDGQVVLGRHDIEIVVPLRRK